MIEQETPVEEKSVAKLADMLRERGVVNVHIFEEDDCAVVQFRADSQYRAFEIADIAALHGYTPAALQGCWNYSEGWGERELPVWLMIISTCSLK